MALIFVLLVVAGVVSLWLGHDADPQWLEAAGVFGTLLVTSGAAVLGLDMWRAEAQGRRRAELAEQALTLCHRAANLIRSTRAPTPPRSGQSGDANSGGYEMRLSHLLAGERVFGELMTVNYKSALLMDLDLSEPISTFRRLEADLVNSLRLLSRVPPEPSNPTAQKIFKETLSKAESTVTARKDDEVEVALKDAISIVEERCKPHLILELN